MQAAYNVCEAVRVTVLLSLVNLLSGSNSRVVTSNDNTEVGVLVSRTTSLRTSTDLRQVVGDVHTEAVQLVQHQAISQTTLGCVVFRQKTRVFILQKLKQHWVDDQPATRLVNILTIHQTSHTSNNCQRRHSSSGESSHTRQTRSQRDGVVTSRNCSDRGEITLLQRVGRQQFCVQSSGNSFSTRNVRKDTSSVSSAMNGRLLVASEVAKDFLVKLVTDTITSTISSHLHEVDVAVSLFNVIHFEGKSISLINGEREVFINQVLGNNLLTTSVRGDGNFHYVIVGVFIPTSAD